MTVAHFGIAIVAAFVGRDWRGHTIEGNICAGLICFPPSRSFLIQISLHFPTEYRGDPLHGLFLQRYSLPAFVQEELL